MAFPEPLTADEHAQILNQVGDPDNTLDPLLDVFWNVIDRAVIATSRDLGLLYLKKSILEVVMAQHRNDTNIGLSSSGISDSQSAMFDHAKQMYDEALAEIKRIEAVVQAGRDPVVGTIQATEIASPPFGGADAHDPLYTGSPYRARVYRP